MADIGKVPTSTLESPSRREFLAKGGILLAAATLPATAMAASGIKDSTRKRVAELQASDPKFKLSADAQRCLDGTEKDPECDQFINDEASEYVRTKEINAERQQVKIMKEATENLTISRAMTQLVEYIFLDKVPSKDKDYMNEILSYQSTPNDIRETMKEMLTKKKSRKPFTKVDANQMLDLAQRHLDKSVLLTGKLSNPELQRNAIKASEASTRYLRMLRGQFGLV